MAQSSYRRHCKNLFSDCASYSDDEADTDDDNGTLSPLSPVSIPSSPSSVTVSSISAVHNMVLIILSSITVSVISLYSVVIIHRSQHCLPEIYHTRPSLKSNFPACRKLFAHTFALYHYNKHLMRQCLLPGRSSPAPAGAIWRCHR